MEIHSPLGYKPQNLFIEKKEYMIGAECSRKRPVGASLRIPGFMLGQTPLPRDHFPLPLKQMFGEVEDCETEYWSEQ
jgi:hypothetical protein